MCPLLPKQSDSKQCAITVPYWFPCDRQVVLSIFEGHRARVPAEKDDDLSGLVAAMPQSSCALYEMAAEAVLSREGLLAAKQSGSSGGSERGAEGGQRAPRTICARQEELLRP